MEKSYSRLAIRDGYTFRKSHPSRNLLTETENSLPQLTEKEVMACWGMKDFCFHPEFLKKWKEIIPSMQVFEYQMLVITYWRMPVLLALIELSHSFAK